MDKKFFIETNNEINTNELNNLNNYYTYSPTNDNVVNDFLNKNVSLESLIEKEIY